MQPDIVQGNLKLNNYCNRKISKKIGTQSKPNESQLASIKTVVSLYDKTFYQKEKARQMNYNETLDEENITFSEKIDSLQVDENGAPIPKYSKVTHRVPA